jgi:hypothetical protein
MSIWVVVATNGKFRISRRESRRLLKEDIRNSYEWKGDVCQILLWSSEPYVPSDGFAIPLNEEDTNVD